MPLPISGAVHEAGASQDFTWFIYGSSLDREAFGAWAAQHGHRVPDFARAVPARLPGHRLVFDVASRFWGGAVGSLAPDPHATVEGIALPLPGAARPLADHKEGAVSGLFQPAAVQVEPLAGGAPIPAIAYVASPDRRLPAPGAPARAWLETVLRGARASGLSPAWIAGLEALAQP